MTVIRDSVPDFDLTVPVLVIGAGACGMAAALAARDAGADVVVLEQDRAPFGSTGMSYGGACAADTASEQRLGIADSKEQFLADILAMTSGRTDPALARAIAYEAGPTIDWLADRHDVILEAEPGWTGLGHSAARLHFPADRSGSEFVGMLTGAVERCGVDSLFSARVDALYATPENRVTGVRVRRPDGIEQIGCEKLILATCGFGANAEMVDRYIPELKGAQYYGHEGNRGDGIVWGEALGGTLADMGAYQALGLLSAPECVVVPPTLTIAGGFQVNSAGRRFHNELADVSGQALRVLAQPGAVSWIIYDDRLHQQARDGYAEYRAGEALNPYKSADTPGGLAEATGIAADGLAATMADVAQLKADGGRDTFGRSFADAYQLTPPYFAVRVTGALFHTQGGLQVDAHARVVGAGGRPLPNLYAGGGAARGVSGPGGWGYLPGMGLCAALTLGRLAGDHAARSLGQATELVA
ncbi:MAG: FAD-dependent oxidoreductase [Sphingomonadales bacterium]|nr:FAD-dependent oxidoreductase [Sphingomonadales bacterium]